MLKRPSNGIRNMAYDRYYRIQAPRQGLYTKKEPESLIEKSFGHRQPYTSDTRLNFSFVDLALHQVLETAGEGVEESGLEAALEGPAGLINAIVRSCFTLIRIFGSSLRRICGIWREARSNSTGTSWSLKGI